MIFFSVHPTIAKIVRPTIVKLIYKMIEFRLKPNYTWIWFFIKIFFYLKKKNPVYLRR